MFDFLVRNPEIRRRRLLRRVQQSALREFLSVPFPDAKLPVSELPILAVDFETTGFNPKSDHILSIGSVNIDGLAIRLRSASHDIVRVDTELRASNVIYHKITDGEKNAGISAEKAITQLLKKLQGRVLLSHFNKTEVEFLSHTCKRLYGQSPVFQTIDTLEIAAKRWQNAPSKLTRENLRLFNLRKDYNLPEYAAHNALSDALSAAELFLAQINHLPDGSNTKLCELY